MSEWVHVAGDAASVLTAAVAVWAWAEWKIRTRDRMKRLEAYLLEARRAGSDKGQRSLLHLSARLGIPEQELVNLAYRSNKIERRIRPNAETGIADELLLEFRDEVSPR